MIALDEPFCFSAAGISTNKKGSGRASSQTRNSTDVPPARKTKAREQSIRSLKQKIEKTIRRIQELDRRFTRIYEHNAPGKHSGERYTRMSAAYESKQKKLAAVESDEQAVWELKNV